MTSFAHIINPVRVNAESDLFSAIPITFASMREARKFQAPDVEIEQWTAQYPEDKEIIPADFQQTPDLERSILDMGDFKKQRKLPLIKDILDRLYHQSRAEYMIYTNADIALQPHFYWSAAKIIQEGYDAFIINRRTIPGHYRDPADLPIMLAETGEPHKGWDCFVFKRAFYPRFRLEKVCIGTGWFGRASIVNMSCLARGFKIFEDMHLTFHIGNEQAWRNPEFDDYLNHNQMACKKILAAWEEEIGPLDRQSIPGKFISLLEKLNK